jgi:hypothetical protein
MRPKDHCSFVVEDEMGWMDDAELDDLEQHFVLNQDVEL